ncbi:uncharacterized protein BP01DRAFT_354369 [Aspergillus saccharolyticus JOP 1030-1]|uniref:Uncharacterized protein n=1 Tax=Aspergillus saccharolyticus JOP 1030-1 TaxID=1450539 RepID=A0A318ZUY6_9EURO|nr:hypothetical protein BP01DRAFT_354369 [Aspergillus saccharolyticus JOP 1030-1]PYH47830.1 hypothetical protein BP01DRAFT_354369 [Aspergillus saccharolyticus JOP 1030-1]
MPTPRLLYLLTPPALLTFTIHRGLLHLETQYPAVPPGPASHSPALLTPAHPATQRCAAVDIYQARVPVAALLRTARKTLQQAAAAAADSHRDGPETQFDASQPSLRKAWAVVFLTSPILTTEAKLVGLLRTGTFQPGDRGLSIEGFGHPAAPDRQRKRELINGVLTVERAPDSSSSSSSHGLLVSWTMPDAPREFFEYLAGRWRYPYRLMSGGRHEWSVSEPYLVGAAAEAGGDGPPGEEWVVDVRFASAHDYEVVAAEGEDQKVIPGWTGRLHRGYARLLLLNAVHQIQG